MTTILIVLGFIVLVAMFALVWKTAKIHELHKIRKVFNNTYNVYVETYGDQEGPVISGFMKGLSVLDKIEESEKKTLL